MFLLRFGKEEKSLYLSTSMERTRVVKRVRMVEVEY